MNTQGLILFAHGARDPRWAEPFLRLRVLLRQARPDVPVELAFLELMQPDLASAVASLSSQGCQRIVIAPIFLGQGGHVRRDLPLLIENLSTHFPQIEIVSLAAAGESEDVLQAIAGYCLAAI